MTPTPTLFINDMLCKGINQALAGRVTVDSSILWGNEIILYRKGIKRICQLGHETCLYGN